MFKADYTDDERETFQHWRYHYPDTRVMRRFEILWLHSCGKHSSEIAPLVQQHVRTVRAVIKMYQTDGIERIMTLDSHRPVSELEQHRTSLIEDFTKRPPASAKEAAYRTEKLTGLKRSPERLRVFMKKIGMQCRKVGAIPAKADLEKQEDFKKKC